MSTRVKRLFIVLSFCISCILSGHAVTINGLSYSLNDATATASVVYDQTYSNGLNNVVIPQSVYYLGKTYKVDRIDNRAFEGVTIKSLTIPASVKNIGYKAFLGSVIETLILEPSNESLIVDRCGDNDGDDYLEVV